MTGLAAGLEALEEPVVLADVWPGLTGVDSFMDRRRKILRFLVVLPTE